MAKPRAANRPEPNPKTRSMTKRCAGRNARGGRCGRGVTRGAEYCYSHASQEPADRTVNCTPKTKVSARKTKKAAPEPAAQAWIPIVIAKAKDGASVVSSALAAGIDRSAIYQYADDWPEFAEEWSRARAIGERLRADQLEDALFEALVNRSTRVTVTEKTTNDEGEEVITVTERKFDARSTIAHLKVKRAGKQNERHEAVTVVITDDDGGPRHG